MHTTLFDTYRESIRNLPASGFDEKLLIERDGGLSIYYAPFDYVNPAAKVVIVGITPGRTQMVNALVETQRQIRRNADADTALREAKRTGAFSGTLRPNLVAMLDYIGLNSCLGIRSTEELFGAQSHLVQTASALPFPVFTDGKPYKGTPNMVKHPMLRRHLREYFGVMIKPLKGALFVPLGEKVSEALVFLSAEGFIDADRILDGLPHPSPQNAERVAYFLDRKPASRLSVKTNAAQIDTAKQKLLSRMKRLRPN